MPKGCIIYCIEGGILEKYTLLSIASIKQFGGYLSEYDIFCIQPRQEFPISNFGKKQLEEFHVKFIDQRLNKRHRYYSIVNKPLAISHIMEQYDYDQYIFLDGDTIILNEPKQFLEVSTELLLSPVYTKGIGIHELPEKQSIYWNRLFQITKSDISNLQRVKTILEEEDIIGYWNAGIMVINGKSPLIKDWLDLTLSLLDKQIYPESGIFFVEQSALAATIHAHGLNPKALDLSHNFPLTKKIFQIKPISALQEICVVHLLNNLDLLNDIPATLISENKKLWISEKLNTFKINNNGLPESLFSSFQEMEKKMKERFYYFIYKFTNNKKDN